MNLPLRLWGAILTISLLASAACSRQYIAERHLDALKQHGLVMQLRDPAKPVDYLRKEGLNQKADRMQRYIDSSNVAVIRHFRKHYNFGPVYFVYSSKAEALKRGERVLLNDRLEIDSAIEPPAVIHLAAFGRRVDGHNSLSWESFYVLDTPISVKPHWWPVWRSFDFMNERDVKKVNKFLGGSPAARGGG